MKAAKGKHRADVNPKLDLLLRNVGGSTKININYIHIKYRVALLINFLLLHIKVLPFQHQKENQSVAWYACEASLGKERYVRLN